MDTTFDARLVPHLPLPPPRGLRRRVAGNLLALGSDPAGWDAEALLVLRAAAPTVAREGASLLSTLTQIGRRMLALRAAVLLVAAALVLHGCGTELEPDPGCSGPCVGDGNDCTCPATCGPGWLNTPVCSGDTLSCVCFQYGSGE